MCFYHVTFHFHWEWKRIIKMEGVWWRIERMVPILEIKENTGRRFRSDCLFLGGRKRRFRGMEGADRWTEREIVWWGRRGVWSRRMTKDKVVAREESSRFNHWRGCSLVGRGCALASVYRERILHLHLLLNEADGESNISQSYDYSCCWSNALYLPRSRLYVLLCFQHLPTSPDPDNQCQ